MKNLIFFLLIAFAGTMFSCANARESSSTSISNNTYVPSSTTNSTAVSSNSNNSNTNSANTSAAKKSFWTEAADGGLSEVEMGKMAVKKAQNPEVKKFAQMMITDHSKANNELKAVAAKQKITLPTEIGPRNRSTIDELNKLEGANFDREYVQAMVDDHEADVQMFEDQAQDDSDSQAKAFAAKALPVLKKHLEAIKAIQSKMK